MEMQNRARKSVEIFTDGACRGNPGPGGWAAILRWGGFEKELTGGAAETTNNRMELTAAIEGLSALKEPCIVHLYSDSKYLTDAVNQGWLDKWRAKAWKRQGNEPVKNEDLWKRLCAAMEPHCTAFIWVRGHDGHPENERCDALATASADAYDTRLNHSEN